MAVGFGRACSALRQRFLFPLSEKTPSYFTTCLLPWERNSTTHYKKFSYSTSAGREGSLFKGSGLAAGVSLIQGKRETQGSIVSDDILVVGRKLRKSKGPKEVSYRIRQLCKIGDVDTAKELLYEALSDVDVYDPTNMFNCIMYWCMNLGRFDDVYELLSVMETRKYTFDEGTISVLIQFFSKTESVHKGIELLKKVESLEGLLLRPKMYVPLVITAAKMGDLDTAFSLYEDMKAKTAKKECTTDELYECLIQSCTKTGEKRWRDKVEGIFLDFRSNRVTLPPKMLSSIKDYFLSQVDTKWNVKIASVDKMGRCQGCGELLDSGELSSAEHAVLKNHLSAMLQQAVSKLPEGQVKCFTSVGNYVDRFDFRMPQASPQSLKRFIAMTGPYDVVLDSLNIGYYGQHSKRSHQRFSTQVKRVVTHFLEDNKRVLVVGSKPLSFREWRKNPEKPVGSLVKFLYQHCGLFLVADRSLDDHYFLCAALHCGPGTQLVSTDKFSDHVSCIEPNLKSLFVRWQRLSQVEGQHFEKQLPVDPVIQMAARSQHFPSESLKEWLCVTRAEQ